MKYIVERLKERTTYQGLTLLLGVFGVAISPDLLYQIGMGVASVYGLVQTFLPESAS